MFMIRFATEIPQYVTKDLNLSQSKELAHQFTFYNHALRIKNRLEIRYHDFNRFHVDDVD